MQVLVLHDWLGKYAFGPSIYTITHQLKEVPYKSLNSQIIKRFLSLSTCTKRHRKFPANFRLPRFTTGCVL